MVYEDEEDDTNEDEDEEDDTCILEHTPPYDPMVTFHCPQSQCCWSQSRQSRQLLLIHM